MRATAEENTGAMNSIRNSTSFYKKRSNLINSPSVSTTAFGNRLFVNDVVNFFLQKIERYIVISVRSFFFHKFTPRFFKVVHTLFARASKNGLFKIWCNVFLKKIYKSLID